MAVPKSRTSKSKKKMRRAQNFKLEVPALSVCTKCGEAKLPHRVCKKCGTYNNIEVLKVEQ